MMMMMKLEENKRLVKLSQKYCVNMDNLGRQVSVHSSMYLSHASVHPSIHP